MRVATGLRVAATMVAIALPGVAAAQSATYFDRNNNVSVMDRPRPDYQATGINLGAFQLFPSVTGAEAYDDNVFASSTGRVGDWITSISPSVDLRSNWSRNSLELTASDISSFYASQTGEDTNDYQANLLGRVDIGYASSISGSIGYGHSALPRTSEITLGDTLDPIEYDTLNAKVGAVQTLNRLQFTESITYGQTAYANATDVNGNPLQLSQSDSNQTTLNAKASWAVSPDIALFLNGQYNIRRYNNSQGLNDRNSTGYEVTAGADFDITRLIRGQLQLGYISQNYQSPLYHPVSGPDVHAKIEYFLSGLTTITVHADRSVVDVVDPVAVSFLQTVGGAEIDHELLRNVILSGRADYESDDFTGVDRTDRRTTLSLRGSYLLSRRLGLTAGYSFIDLQSSGPARVGSYDANMVTLSLVFQL